MERYDVIVVGAGPGGLAAGTAARKCGAGKVLVLERDDRPGGILNQCIHDGFGLIHYKQALTGPEYAGRAIEEALEAGVQIKCGAMVTDIRPERIVTAASRSGLHRYSAGAIVLATGCRERTRGAVSIPGPRPAGVLTAGVAQNLINIQNILPGRHVVILGSGDIGLIMARRLKLEGAEVQAVVEMLPEPSGLKRNVCQCLYDFGIPLYTNCTVTEVLGHKRVEGVKTAQIGPDGKIRYETQKMIPCDTLVLSVGLIPENELAKSMGIELEIKDNSMPTDEYLQTKIPGVFSCGNSRRVMDLADYVSRQGALAGQNAAAFSMKKELTCGIMEYLSEMPKGFPAAGCIICTRCPKGCELSFDREGNPKGYTCRQGAEFAILEQTKPMRILTTTIRTQSGRLVPVRSDTPIPRQKMIEYAGKLGKIVLQDEAIFFGQVLIKNFEESGADITATGSL